MNPKTHEFIGFEESHLPNKKYNVILKNKTSGRLKDNTGLGKFSNLNHLDKQRRQNHIKTHFKVIGLPAGPPAEG